MDRTPDTALRPTSDEIRIKMPRPFANENKTTTRASHTLGPAAVEVEKKEMATNRAKQQQMQIAELLMSWAGQKVQVANHLCPQARLGTGPAGSSSYTAVASSALGSTAHAHASSSPGRKSARGQKRLHDHSGGDDDDGPGRGGPRPGNKRHRGDERGRLSFACPFFKKDPVRWRPCYKHELRRIRDVKQHLRRAHPVRPYCPTCGEVFEDDPTEDRLNRHLRSRECQPKAFDRPQGITWQQREQLSRRVPARLSEADQWFVVFDTVFPGHPRPPTPYVDPDMSEDLSSYFEFSAARGSQILRQSISRHARSFASVDGDALESLLRQGLDDLRVEWFSSRSGALGPPSRPGTEQTTPASSNFDGPGSSLDADAVSLRTPDRGASPFRAAVVDERADLATGRRRPRAVADPYSGGSLTSTMEEDMSWAVLSLLSGEGGGTAQDSTRIGVSGHPSNSFDRVS